MEKQLPSPVRILMYMLKWLVVTAILGVFMGFAFFDSSIITDQLIRFQRIPYNRKDISR